jgi:hypothetical protein
MSLQAVNIAIGPPIPELNAQKPGTGLIFGNKVDNQPRRFIFKKAHLSQEDFRIFDYHTKCLVAVLHHWGKNPYESLDPLGIGNNPAEMESLCRVTGVPVGSNMEVYALFKFFMPPLTW